MSFQIYLPDYLDLRIGPIQADGTFRTARLPLADMAPEAIIADLCEGGGRMARDIKGDAKYNRVPQVRWDARIEYVEVNLAAGNISQGGRQTDVVLEGMRQTCLEYGVKKSECKAWNYQRIQTFLDASGATTFKAEMDEVKRGIERKAKIVASIGTDVPPPPVKVPTLGPGTDEIEEMEHTEE